MMDDLTKQRFDRIDRRLDDMPKAIATAFVEAFANARTALAGDIQAYHADTEQAAERRHGELMRALTAMVGAVPTRAELRDDGRFGELTKAVAELRAELLVLKGRSGGAT